METELRDMELQLNKIELFITGKSAKMNISDWCGEERDNTYKVQLSSNQDEFTDCHRRIIKKYDLMIARSHSSNNHTHLAYSIWCKPDVIELAKQKLKDRLEKSIQSMKDSVDSMYDFYHSNEKSL